MSRARECGDKIAYDTKELAEGAAWNRRRSLGATGHATNVYKCRFCGKWHIGHKPRRRHQR